MKTIDRKYKTDFLLRKNDFFNGLSSLLNIFGSHFHYNYSKSAQEADSKALYSDWYNVGSDLNNSMSILKDQLEVLEKITLLRKENIFNELSENELSKIRNLPEYKELENKVLGLEGKEKTERIIKDLEELNALKSSK